MAGFVTHIADNKAVDLYEISADDVLISPYNIAIGDNVTAVSCEYIIVCKDWIILRIL